MGMKRITAEAFARQLVHIPAGELVVDDKYSESKKTGDFKLTRKFLHDGKIVLKAEFRSSEIPNIASRFYSNLD